MVCGLAADEESCVYVPFSAAVLTELHAELRGYQVERGVIRFHPQAPLPRTLVRGLVQARMRQATRPD